MPIVGTLGVVITLILIFVAIANTQSASQATATETATAIQQLTHVDAGVINQVKTGGIAMPLQAISGQPAPLAGAGGKPEILYVGAEFCPFCAAQRWSVIQALSRFGTFSNLQTTTSSAHDAYPDTPTFTFVGSSYSSDFIVFTPVEIEDRDQQPLQTLTTAQQQIFQHYDAPPYADESGGIPFMDFGNVYLAVSSGFQPDVLAGKDWSAIASSLTDPTSPVTQGIVGNANVMTAAICRLTKQQPAAACQTATITAIAAQLPGHA